MPRKSASKPAEAKPKEAKPKEAKPKEEAKPEESARPQQQRQRVREGERADIVRLKPTAISEADRKALNLWQKRALMIDELGTVPKRGWNDHHKYNYALEADVVAYLGPLMSKYMVVTKIDVILEKVERIEMNQTRGGGTMTLTRLPLKVEFINADNPDEREEFIWLGEGSDTGDKGVYKSYTGALKYLYMKWFLIATGDDPEAFERTDALNESGGRRGVEALSDGEGTEVRRSSRPQPERGGRQTETTRVQIQHLSNLSTGLNYGPRGTAEVIDQVLNSRLTDTLDAIDDEAAQRQAVVHFLQERPGTDTGKVIHEMTKIAERASQMKSEQEVASAQTEYVAPESESEDDLIAAAKAEVDAENERIANLTEEDASDEGGVTKTDLDGSGS